MWAWLVIFIGRGEFTGLYNVFVGGASKSGVEEPF